MKRLLTIPLLFLSTAYAANFIVNDGQTVVVSQILANPGDVGLIEELGKITTVGDGVIMQSSNQQVLNKGTIITTGNSGNGIFNNAGANVQIFNSGSILTS